MKNVHDIQSNPARAFPASRTFNLPSSLVRVPVWQAQGGIDLAGAYKTDVA